MWSQLRKKRAAANAQRVSIAGASQAQQRSVKVTVNGTVNQPGVTVDIPVPQTGDVVLDTPEADGETEPEQLSKLDQLRKEFDSGWSQMTALLKAVRAPVPTQTGDGTALPPPTPVHTYTGELEVVLRDLVKLGFTDVHDLAHVIESANLGNALDDKKYYMEHLIQAAAKLPVDVVQTDITNSFLKTLWNDLEHPPQTMLGQHYEFRQPDGSQNNYLYPHVGQAGQPYARTVPPLTANKGAMPDPGVLFDTLMARKDPAGTEHPTRISSMLFYLASIIIHDIFRTNRTDYNISDTSSYLDLAPLYGSTWTEQKRMRTMRDGKIKPDCFSETRLLTFPPGVGALLIMFNRFHNYVVEQLALINEGGRFTENAKQPTVERYGEIINARDDDLFQTARLVTCGLYINIILIDYVRTILNLNRTDDNWQLNPRVDIPNGPPTGTGNQVSAEFNLIYRWHATISRRDDLWTQELFKEMFPGITPAEAGSSRGLERFLGMLGQLEKSMGEVGPEERPFPALKSERLTRIPDGPYKGNYSDDDLAAILTAGVEDCANAYGPQQVPTVLKAIEVLGIMQTRSWHCATLNEFRKYFALEPHRTFESITENKEVADALKHLYDTPDMVELYPGLVVEDAKIPMIPGSGLCPSYTVSRAVLSDAVSLVRGDRLYTSGYTTAALTNWGYSEASSDLSIDNGCVMYKLFLTALPKNYAPNSVYVHYPFTVPHGRDGMHDVLKRLGKAHMYNFEVPKPIVQPTILFSYDAAKQVLSDKKNFHVTWEPAMEFLMGKAVKDFCLAGDGPANEASRNLLSTGLYLDAPANASWVMPSTHEKWYKAVKDYYEDITTQLLAEKSYKLGEVNEVDIIRDIGNLTHVHFCAEMFNLPLKTAEFPHGLFTDAQLYLLLVAIFTSIFFDTDPSKSFYLRQQAHKATQVLGGLVAAQVDAIKATGKFGEWLIDAIKPIAKPMRDYGTHMIAKLIKEDPDSHKLAWGNILPTVGSMSANQGQLFGQAMDYFFTDGLEHWPAINALAKEDTPEADEKLLHYLMEATRLRGEVGVFRWAEADVTIVDTTPELGSITHNFKKGDKLLVNLKAAGRDPTASPDPEKFDLSRPIDSYMQYGYGPHQCLGLPMSRVALTTMLKVVGRLDGLRPAPVSVGATPARSTVKKVAVEFQPGDSAYLPASWHYHAYLTEDWDMYFPFPTTLRVNFDGPVPTTKSQGNGVPGG